VKTKDAVVNVASMRFPFIIPTINTIANMDVGIPIPIAPLETVFAYVKDDGISVMFGSGNNDILSSWIYPPNPIPIRDYKYYNQDSHENSK